MPDWYAAAAMIHSTAAPDPKRFAIRGVDAVHVRTQGRLELLAEVVVGDQTVAQGVEFG